MARKLQILLMPGEAGSLKRVYFSDRLATPYVLEWNFGVQREFWKRFTFEARYVGNHAVKQYRAWNIDEIDFQNNGLLTEFRNAQTNLAIGGTRFDN